MSLLTQKNQTFRTVDLLALVALVGGIGSVTGVVLAQAFQDQRPAKAEAAAEMLALQIEAHEIVIEKAPQNTMVASRAANGRAPASVSEEESSELKSMGFANDGNLGKDPWGRAYHYAIRKHPTGVSSIFVWSDGPDGKSQSELGAGPAAQFSRGGDDIVKEREFKTL